MMFWLCRTVTAKSLPTWPVVWLVAWGYVRESIIELEKSVRRVSNIRYHLVTAVRHRLALLTIKIEECIRETEKGISERYEMAIDEIGFYQNHTKGGI